MPRPDEPKRVDRAVRECEALDVPLIVSYFVDAERSFLTLLGADPDKLPPRQQWIDTLCEDLNRPVRTRERYYLIWEVEGVAIGHSNLSDIEFGCVGNMHLHIWTPTRRRMGIGTELVKASIDRYFDVFQLETLLCEPHAANPAPNRTLPKLGFELVERYSGVPGSICFPQQVNRWRLTKGEWHLTQPSPLR